AEVCMNTIFCPTIEAMAKEGRPFKGVIYFGLMITAKGPKVIEYNARFGDPETQVVLPRLKTDLLEIINAVIDEKLDTVEIEWENNACVCVVAASGGYPTKYAKGYEINGLDKLEGRDDIMVFHAGTDIKDGKLVTSGGRVLGVTAKGANLDEAIAKAYEAIKSVEFTDMHYRRDIGVK
ncbi:MAG: phosphoribosylamine--glycine ligase, partial [Clostridia bacterium]|nr:phosphoribosylamine--glycine ligase [Clostridia bacterium]